MKASPKNILLSTVNHRLMILTVVVVALSFSLSCKKIVSIPEPVTTITTAEAFSSDAEANSVIAGIYSAMINTSDIYMCSGALTVYPGMSADELNSVNQTATYLVEFQNNNIQSTNGVVGNNIWIPATLTFILQTLQLHNCQILRAYLSKQGILI